MRASGTVAIAMPPMTRATPRSCVADGDSRSRMMLRPTVMTGWAIRMIYVTSAGRRESETEISR